MKRFHVAALALWVLAAGQARADVLYNNFGSGDSYTVAGGEAMGGKERGIEHRDLLCLHRVGTEYRYEGRH